MQTNDRVSIIIPCYKQAQYLREAILSCLNQEIKPHEIIVINDGSPDNTSEIAKQYPVKLIEQDNLGLPAARNSGILASTGDWILCLDADDKLREDFIGKFLNIDSDIVCVGVQEFGTKDRRWYSRPEQLTIESMTKENATNCSCPFKRTVWDSIGGFNELMRGGKEDWDFYPRALSAGFKITPISDYLLFYRRK